MWNKPLIAAVVAAVMVVAAAGYVVATEPGRIKAAEQELYAAAAQAAQEVTEQIEPTVILTVVSQCPDGEQVRTEPLSPDGVTADAVIALVDEGCTFVENSADLDLKVPNVQGAEGPLTGNGFREARGQIELTTEGMNVTVKVSATAKAGIFRRPIATTAQAQYSGEGLRNKVLQNLRSATAEAVPVLAERAEPENPPVEVIIEAEPEPQKETAPTSVDGGGTTSAQTPVPVTPLAPEQIISPDKMQYFPGGAIFTDMSPSEFEKWINEVGKKWQGP